MNNTIIGIAQNGKLKLAPDELAMWRNILASLTGEVEITIRRRTADRSDEQNKYYWGVVIKMICDETGNFPQAQHKCLKDLFKIDTITDMSTAQFARYIEMVIAWAAQTINVVIPPAK